MARRLILTVIVFLLVGVVVFAVTRLGGGDVVALPQRIAVDTTCPVAGCMQPDGACHAAGPYPTPDGNFLMNCPRVVGCTDTNCHAWDRIEGMRSKPSEASMNLWILAPVLLVVALVAMVYAMEKRPAKNKRDGE
ncbi:MAG: hypothetical protein LBI64_05275 [Coriobacteriales bacterium]|jgi:hypothetical protein|nr:hypothetical protein [Coriobacteriales bacterium]